MFIRLNHIDADGLAIDERISLKRDVSPTGDLAVAADVRVRGHFKAGPDRRNPAEKATFSAALSGELQLRCSRCIEPYAFPLAVDFDLILVSKMPEPEDGEHQIEAHQTHFFEIEESRLDLQAVSREQVILALPQKPICRPDCQGLCPTCGINKNALKCGCREETLDPRLQALQDIRDKMSDSRG